MEDEVNYKKIAQKDFAKFYSIFTLLSENIFGLYKLSSKTKATKEEIKYLTDYLEILLKFIRFINMQFARIHFDFILHAAFIRKLYSLFRSQLVKLNRGLSDGENIAYLFYEVLVYISVCFICLLIEIERSKLS